MAFFVMGETETFHVVDNLLTVTPGDPIRLLPLGKLVYRGKERDITPDILRRMRLPHFKPPIKRGSHADDAPALGHIVGLEVRDDGLWGIPELNDEGRAAMERGDYRYHSPEILWDGAYEDPATGNSIDGPLIVGDALLHTPHLGEAAALYTSTVIGASMSEQTMQVPVSFWQQVMEKLFPAAPITEPADPAPTPDPIDSDQMTAVVQERDDLAARIAEYERREATAGRIAHFAAEFKDTSLAESADLFGALAGLTDAQAEPIVTQMKALAEQVRVSELTAAPGASGDGDEDPDEALDAAIRTLMSAENINYAAATKKLAVQRPELFQAYGA